MMLTKWTGERRNETQLRNPWDIFFFYFSYPFTVYAVERFSDKIQFSHSEPNMLAFKEK